jgi:PleD family two-component response regulator
MNLRSLYGAADVSLYAAKRAGRDRVGPMPEPVLPVPSAA